MPWLKGAKHADDLPADQATWQGRITKRKEVLDQARAEGDQEWEGRAAANLDRALDGYNRDCR